MGVLSGRKIGYAGGKETTRGTAVAPTYGFHHLEGDFKDRAEKIINDSAIGVLANANDAQIVKEWAEGDIATKFNVDSGGLMMLAAFGNVSSVAKAAPNASVYDHTFTMQESNEPRTLTLVRKEDNMNKRYAMAMCRKWEIEVVVGEYVRVNTSWISKKGVTGVDTVTFALEKDFTPKYATLKRAANVAGLAGATPLKPRRFRLAIEKTVEPDYVFGSNDPDNIFLQEYNVGGEIEIRYEDTSLYDLYRTDTKNALQLTLLNTDVTIGTSANPGLVLQTPTVAVDEWDVDQGKGDIVIQTLGFKGLFSIADAQAVQAILTNLVAAY